MTSHAARGGRLDVLQWAFANGCPAHGDMLLAAATRGRLSTLEWLHGSGHHMTNHIKWKAYRSMDLGTMIWARTLPCPQYDSVDAFDERIAKKGIKHGRADVLRWLHECGHRLSAENVNEIARMGNLVLMEWMRANCYSWTTRAYACAAKRGHIHVLEWLLLHGCPCVYSGTLKAARKASQERVVGWLIDHRGDLDRSFRSLA